MDEAEQVFNAAVIANRVLGCVNAPSFMQRVIKRCIDAKADVAAYDRNRNLLYEGLKSFGFECIRPEGAFYLFMKTPGDEKEFCERAKKIPYPCSSGKLLRLPGLCENCLLRIL